MAQPGSRGDRRSAEAERPAFDAELASMRLDLAIIRCRRAARKAGFRPDQPRVPAGQPGGGQWTDGAEGAEGEPISRVQLAQLTDRQTMTDLGVSQFSVPIGTMHGLQGQTVHRFTVNPLARYFAGWTGYFMSGPVLWDPITTPGETRIYREGIIVFESPRGAWTVRPYVAY